jgi:hypothetical protein
MNVCRDYDATLSGQNHGDLPSMPGLAARSGDKSNFSIQL